MSYNHKLKGRTRFGKLTVIGDVVRRTVVHRNGRAYHKYYCQVRCDCGTVKEVLVSGMHEGTTMSCSCHRHAQHNRITGKIFAESRGARGHG